MFPLGDNIASTRFAAAVWGLIAINVAVFLYQVSLPAGAQEIFLAKYALIPARYFHPSWASEVGLNPLDVTPFLTNTFLHGGFLHIIVNMWTLYIFGPALEERLGSARFLALYLGSGVIASLAHAIFNLSSALPALGASGAIAGVIAAYALSFPHAWIRVLVLIVIIPIFFWVPALVFAGLLVPDAGAAGNVVALSSDAGRRHRLVGAHRRLSRRLVPAPAPRHGALHSEPPAGRLRQSVAALPLVPLSDCLSPAPSARSP